MKHRLLPAQVTQALCLVRLGVCADVRRIILAFTFHDAFEQETADCIKQRLTLGKGNRTRHRRALRQCCNEIARVVDYPPDPEDEEMTLMRIVNFFQSTGRPSYVWQYFYRP